MGQPGEMQFEFATATQIVFGEGTVSRLPRLVAPLGQRALLVTGRTPARVGLVLDALRAEQIEVDVYPVSGEPTTATVQEGVERARRFIAHVVVACGGGSVIDTGKAIAAVLSNGGEPRDFLEIVGAGRQLSQPSAPFFAVPTTAGTGAEVTRNAVLLAEEHRVKVSMRSHRMLPRVALVDPELTYSVPPRVTATTGLDALTQLVEPFVSSSPNPLTDAICREGLGRVARSLLRAVRNGEDGEARRDMALASLFGGLALANARLGAVHGFAGPIGGMFSAAHGAVCASLLVSVMKVNLAALRERDSQHLLLARFDEVARIWLGDPAARAEDGIRWLQDLGETIQVPRLRTFGVREEDLDAIVTKARSASSMKGNPVPLSNGELREILVRAI